MLRNKLRHLEHVNNAFSIENFLQVCIGVDVPSVPDGSYGSYTDYNSSVSTNPATNRTAIGCK